MRILIRRSNIYRFALRNLKKPPRLKAAAVFLYPFPDGSATVSYTHLGDWNGRGRSVARMVDGHPRFFHRQAQAVHRRLDDAHIGLVRHNPIKFPGLNSGFFTGLQQRLRHHLCRKFVDLAPAHDHMPGTFRTAVNSVLLRRVVGKGLSLIHISCSKGIQREVSPASSLTRSSHASSPHHIDLIKPVLPAASSLSSSNVPAVQVRASRLASALL